MITVRDSPLVPSITTDYLSAGAFSAKLQSVPSTEWLQRRGQSCSESCRCWQSSPPSRGCRTCLISSAANCCPGCSMILSCSSCEPSCSLARLRRLIVSCVAACHCQTSWPWPVLSYKTTCTTSSEAWHRFGGRLCWKRTFADKFHIWPLVRTCTPTMCIWK